MSMMCSRSQVRLVVHGHLERIAGVNLIRRGVHHMQGFQLLLNGIGIPFVFRDHGSHAGNGDPAEGSVVACGQDKSEKRQKEQQEKPGDLGNHNVTLL